MQVLYGSVYPFLQSGDWQDGVVVFILLEDILNLSDPEKKHISLLVDEADALLAYDKIIYDPTKETFIHWATEFTKFHSVLCLTATMDTQHVLFKQNFGKRPILQATLKSQSANHENYGVKNMVDGIFNTDAQATKDILEPIMRKKVSIPI